MHRALIGTLAAATCSVTLPACEPAPARPCTSPGWLRVTAVASRVADLQTGETEPLTNTYNAARLIDRCEIDGVYQATIAESVRIRMQLDQLDQETTSRSGDPRLTRIHVIDRRRTHRTELFVEESVAEICRALPDCTLDAAAAAEDWVR